MSGFYDIPISNGVLRVDEDDIDLVLAHTWLVDDAGYARAHMESGFNYFHRVVMGDPPDKEVDHENRKKLDCRKNNLRITDRGGNAKNTKMYCNNSTGFRGVTVNGKKFQAQITTNNHNRVIGKFDTKEAAAEAYDKASFFYHGEFGTRNFEGGNGKWVFDGLRRGDYGAILVDPPWSFLTYSGSHTTPHRCAEDHYQTMSFGDLCRLPVSDLSAKNCILFLWVVDSHLEQALTLGRSWNFVYKTRAFEWFKSKKHGEGYGIGMGYYVRKQTESCLLFTRGSPRRLSKGIRQVIEEPRREHSRKPDEVYNRIEQLVAGPYCELFAKHRWPGWDGWGDEYPLDTSEEAYRELTAVLKGLTDGYARGNPC